MQHEIGHLPFENEISKYLNFGVENRITVACDNTLLKDTVPQGSVVEVPTYVTTYLPPFNQLINYINW